MRGNQQDKDQGKVFLAESKDALLGKSLVNSRN